MSERINGRTTSIRHPRPVVIRSPKEVAALGRLRRKAERAIEQLLSVLNEIEGDPDLEETGDDEPSYSRTVAGGQGLGDGEEEPSLGWTSTLNQASGNRLGGTDDHEDEHDGREDGHDREEDHEIERVEAL